MISLLHRAGTSAPWFGNAQKNYSDSGNSRPPIEWADAQRHCKRLRSSRGGCARTATGRGEDVRPRRCLVISSCVDPCFRAAVSGTSAGLRKKERAGPTQRTVLAQIPSQVLVNGTRTGLEDAHLLPCPGGVARDRRPHLSGRGRRRRLFAPNQLRRAAQVVRDRDRQATPLFCAECAVIRHRAATAARSGGGGSSARTVSNRYPFGTATTPCGDTVNRAASSA